MGYNTTIVLYNDALDQIKSDAQLGAKIAKAVTLVSCYAKPEDVSAGNHANAMRVIESHHADLTSLIAVGGNHGSVLRTAYGWRHGDLDWQESMLEDWLAEVRRLKAARSSSAAVNHPGLKPEACEAAMPSKSG